MRSDEILSTESCTLIAESVRHAIGIPTGQVELAREVEDFGHYISYCFTAWMARLPERRFLTVRTPRTYRDWIKAGLIMRWPTLSRWLDVRWDKREHDAYHFFPNVPLRSTKYGERSFAVFFNATEGFTSDGVVE